MNNRLKHLYCIIVSCCMLSLQSEAQQNTDTLKISLSNAEAIFLQHNLQLLAGRYNMNAQKALVIQAKLWPNPNLQLSTPVYNTNSKKLFPFGAGPNGGEITGQISQLITLAGKCNRSVKLAAANAQLSEYQFFDLLRTLKYTLRTDFFRAYYLLQSAKVYNDEISSLQHVVNAFDEQEGKGYVSEKEAVRVKAQLYSLLNEYNDLSNQINDLESELRTLLQTGNNNFIVPQADETALDALDPGQYSLTAMVDSAYANRSDLQIAKAVNEVNGLNYKYQKSLAVPDLTLIGAYDQQGSYINNLAAIGIAIDLPFFNRNQGNIKYAKLQMQASEAMQEQVTATVQENVYRSLQKAVDADKLYKSMDKDFAGKFSKLEQEVMINYQKRNIGLLDFLDFYQSYKDNFLQLNNLKASRAADFEDINYYTGTNFFN